jgi:hypothetical protein
MHEIFNVYTTDIWHSYASRDTIAIATSLETAIKLCKKHAKESGRKISKDQVFNLRNILQTQGHNDEMEYQIEEMDVDTLL